MTGRQRTSSSPTGPSVQGAVRRKATPRVKTALIAAGALVACASLAAACGVVPGISGGSGDDTVTVMTWAPQDTSATNKPGMPAMASAYARWVNAHGGLNGRKLNVLTCNDHNDYVGAAKCARLAVKKKAVAVVGSYSQFGSSFLSPLESAGIPYIGGYGLTDDEFKSVLSYPVNGGQPALLAGLGEELGKSCGPVAMVRPDTVAGDQLPVLLDSGLKAAGHTPGDDVRAAEDATAFDSQAREALREATANPEKKGCVVPSLDSRTGTFMDSFRRLSTEYPTVRTASVLGSVDQSIINESGGGSGPYEGAYVTGWYPESTDKRWDPLKKVIREAAFGDNRIDPADAGVQTTWIAYTVLKKVVDSLGGGEVTANTIRSTLDNGLKVDTGGLTPTLRWRFQDLTAVVDFPRLINSSVTFQVVRDGQLVAARKGFVNVSKTLESTATE
ncbi:ABC transporter substrate-binding protein [Streptomyces chiangmaiensis]|uniref:ABC transporter substrate-binding protein n=1 Tax=Streptomyces chiangmaiensis TaxID=766497 RepID=A0ABU7FBS0_9ACTN|nr:ABC transporter substrate-binding protein [Streptomyces chiangmaiensis]MED7821258.1 ABC transporter substrate-binding protein [Streptomyces chiangmaiensis]